MWMIISSSRAIKSSIYAELCHNNKYRLTKCIRNLAYNRADITSKCLSFSLARSFIAICYIFFFYKILLT